MKSYSKGRGYRAICAAVLVASGSGQFAYAQSEGGDLEEVVVTGTRIKSGNVFAPQPVQTIGARELLRTGQPDITEVLNDNPALLNSVSNTSSTDISAANTGQSGNVGGSALDLRGLGIERTLTLVNGRRHVAGTEGTSAVDIGTIPSALIERVDVLTGGAAAVYGADAVTGVVNFVLKEDFEGLEIDFSPGVSAESDGESYRGSIVWGNNFDSGRGNVTIALQGESSAGLRKRDRSHFRDDGPAVAVNNPAKIFQAGDISAADTPNFDRFYSFASTGRFPSGAPIPASTDAFLAQYAADFPGDPLPTLTAAEQALIANARLAPDRIYSRGFSFGLTSPYGVVALADFGLDIPLGSEPDLDGNGVTDCLQSRQGYDSSLDGAASFGIIGGCWTIDAGGQIVPHQDGLYIDEVNQLFADQTYIAPRRPFVIPENESYSLQVNGRYEFSPALEVFWETKYAYQENKFDGGGHNFTDLLYQSAENPFIPQSFRDVVAGSFALYAGGDPGFHMSRDSDDWSSNVSTNERTTYRVVAGIRGAIADTSLEYELSANYGRFERELHDPDVQVIDRFFAAIDVVEGPDGQPACRSEVDPTAFPFTTPFNIPSYIGGSGRSPFYTFTPGQGQCVPANLWGGRGGISQESIDFFTYDRSVEDTIEQTVITGFVTGDSSDWFSLPAGPVGFAVGAEYREETSATDWDQYDNGIIQVDGVTPDGIPFSAGQNVSEIPFDADLDGGARTLPTNPLSLGDNPAIGLTDIDESYDVYDLFAEVSIPLVADAPLIRELSVDASYRFADYNTVGTNESYGVGVVWSPVDDMRFRFSRNRAVRVPNLFETFGIAGSFFGRNDPCQIQNINNGPDDALRAANCEQVLLDAGVDQDAIIDPVTGDYIWRNPLTAGHPGVTQGNANLDPERGDTTTFGVVLTPRWFAGLTMSIDYWDISIKDAIVAPNSFRIKERCVDSPTLDNEFCALIERQTSGQQIGGVAFLTQTQLNFGATETSGIDYSLGYSTDLLGGELSLAANATWVDELNLIEPSIGGQPSQVDPELEEIRSPEWSGQLSASYMRGRYSVNWDVTYFGNQLPAGAEIETAVANFGPGVLLNDRYIHNVSGAVDVMEGLVVYGGVNNLTDDQPYLSENAIPVSPMGRYFFLGATYNM